MNTALPRVACSFATESVSGCAAQRIAQVSSCFLNTSEQSSDALRQYPVPGSVEKSALPASPRPMAASPACT